jgi:hypothetical protein
VPDSNLAELVDPEAELERQLGELALDPLAAVMYGFPWGTGPLEGHPGPKKWQERFLVRLGKHIRDRGFDGLHAVDPILMARTSGHGIGKSALAAMIVWFLLSTRPMAKGAGTANTGEQLSGKTFAEIAKWFGMAINSHWFQVSTGDMWVRHKKFPSAWRFDALTWQKNKSEAFAGLHNVGSTPFYLFDEGSVIPDVIYDVSLGGLTDGEPMQFVFGNPTRNSGRFYDLFHKLRHRWDTEQIDSRDCELPNHALHAQWIEDCGEDSDFVRVRVKGQFPRAGSKQLISEELVTACRKYAPRSNLTDPLIAGLDVARFGSAESVLAFRKGRDARSIPWRYWRGLDTMQLAGRVSEAIEDLRRQNIRVHALFVDSVGIGAGTADRLRQLNYDAVDVNAGSKDCRKEYKNKGAEMWGRMRDAMKLGLAIPDDDVLGDQVRSREYDFDAVNHLFLESKEDMVDRGLESPDRGDALGFTYAYDVGPVSMDDVPAERPASKWDYDPHGGN